MTLGRSRLRGCRCRRKRSYSGWQPGSGFPSPNTLPLPSRRRTLSDQLLVHDQRRVFFSGRLLKCDVPCGGGHCCLLMGRCDLNSNLGSPAAEGRRQTTTPGVLAAIAPSDRVRMVFVIVAARATRGERDALRPHAQAAHVPRPPPRSPARRPLTPPSF